MSSTASTTVLPTRTAWAGVKVSCSGPVLHEPPGLVAGGLPVQCGHSLLLQVSATQVAMIVGRRVTGVPVVDFADGWDVLVFDRLDAIHPGNLRPGMTNTEAVHPTSSMPLTMVHHYPRGGFVPLGAKLPDGRPHPHAGTGFGVGVLHGYPRDNGIANAHVASDLYSRTQLVQFAFDGQRFSVSAVQNLAEDQLIAGYQVFNRGLDAAVADGEDLLFGIVAGKDDESARAHAQRLAQARRKPYSAAKPSPIGECYGSGLARFRRGPKGWQCIEFVPVPKSGPDMGFEPSLVRDHDGSLLMSMRGKGANVPPGQFDHGLENTYEHFRVYRSADNGRTWESIIHLPEMRAPTPVTINQAANGDLYLAANPYQPLQTDRRGQVVPKARQRDRLWLWKLRDDRRGVHEPFNLLDCNATLGPARACGSQKHDNCWCADHPTSGVYRLADGKLHTLLSFRVIDAATTSGGELASAQAGVWLAELHCSE